MRHQAKIIVNAGADIAECEDRRAAREKKALNAPGGHHPDEANEAERENEGNCYLPILLSWQIGVGNPEQDIAKPRESQQARICRAKDTDLRQTRRTGKRRGHTELPDKEVERECRRLKRGQEAAWGQSARWDLLASLILDLPPSSPIVFEVGDNKKRQLSQH